MGKNDGAGVGSHARGAALLMERPEPVRCMRPIEEFGVEWGFEYANSYSATFFKDLLGKIEAACRQESPVTDRRLQKLFPGIAAAQVQSMQRKIERCADCMTGARKPERAAGGSADPQAACGARLLHAIYTGMQKFWNEIEWDREFVD